jgi:hypothetical protein
VHHGTSTSCASLRRHRCGNSAAPNRSGTVKDALHLHRAPLAAACCRDAALIETGGNGPQRRRAGRLQLGDRRSAARASARFATAAADALCMALVMVPPR